MNNNENTILDPAYAQGNGNAQANQSTQPQQPKTNNTGWGTKAAYGAAGSVVGGGAAMAAQAMASPSDEINDEHQNTTEAANSPLEEVAPAETTNDSTEEATTSGFTTMSANNSSEETPTSEFTTMSANSTPETKIAVDEVTGVTVESAGTTVHISGNSNATVEINDGNIHVTTGTPQNQETTDTTDKTTPEADSTITPPEPEDAIIATSTGVRVAQVDDNATFSQAFADARAQVGPGGVFEWRGRVYGTYYKDEWDSMTADERHDFQANINYNDIISNSNSAQHNNDLAQNTTPTGYTPEHQQDNQDGDDYTTSGYGEDYEDDDDDYTTSGYGEDYGLDDEVRILDIAQTDFDENGIPENSALLEIYGNEIILVDVDRDGVADVAIKEGVDGEVVAVDISENGMEMPPMPETDMNFYNDNTNDYTTDTQWEI